MKRCINIDWLEVFCQENPTRAPRTCEYYVQHGYEVHVRAYGTPQYSEMFTIYENGKPFIEVRRNPYSLKKNEGIFMENDTHLRLANRACYSPNAIEDLRHFLIAHDYNLQSISRIDIALDFNNFDNHEDPQKLIDDYMTGRALKINQSRLSAHGQQWQDEQQDKEVGAHGKDTFYHREWNSLKWGSPTSAITTKLYNKSLELSQTKDKFYIRDAWKEAGLSTEKPVWRCEISIAGVIKNYVKMTDGELVPIRLTDFDNPNKLLFHFHIFANRYFHFKKAIRTRLGTIQRKDRCPDIPLFHYKQGEEAYLPVRLTTTTEPTRTDTILIHRLQAILEDHEASQVVRQASLDLLKYFYEVKREHGLKYYEDYLLLTKEQ